MEGGAVDWSMYRKEAIGKESYCTASAIAPTTHEDEKRPSCEGVLIGQHKSDGK